MSLEDPDFDFVNLVVTIGTSAQASLGEIPDFRTGKPRINMALARSNINMLASLKRKTEGRLSAKEQKVLTDFVEDLQAKYMELLKSGGETALVKAKSSSKEAAKPSPLPNPPHLPSKSLPLPNPPPSGGGDTSQGREVPGAGGGSRAEKLIALIRQKRKEMGV